MNKFVSGGIGVVAALIFFLGSGVAGANDEWKGLTYAKAQEQMQSQGGTIEIASREGSYLPTEQCIVTGNRRANFLDSSGRKSGYTMLVDLNCNDTYAGSGHPGNSAATEEGRKAVKLRDSAKQLSADYEKATAAGKQAACFGSDGSTRYCVKVCTESKACSAELNEALGL